MKDKDMAIHDFRRMIEKSWTYEKLTEEEKEKWEMLLINVRTLTCLKGNYNTRWSILQALYHSYLVGLGYDNFNWREEV